MILSIRTALCAQGSFRPGKPVKRLMKEKTSLSVTEQKISSQLLQAIREYKGEMVKGVYSQPANVNADSAGYLKVDISATVSDSLLNTIRHLGGTVIYPSAVHKTIRAIINLARIEELALSSAVTFIKPASLAITNNTGTITPGID